ncbi:FAD binding domain-containing protein [Paraburkholderia sp.]|jgi:carbon-monoxide dehydrogenase medium subunit|uniref:FAD binding domain-containing protein n=1 Tax=Paraburkholderia sp. TaxID=1926495 RepID=UPI0026345DED|nr:FAD binding domain-containing protein [Paraburkholderia sp.]
MKAAAFDYVRPRDIAQVFALLEEYGDEARIIAGGQTLLATLNMRLSEPQLLIDIGALNELRGISVSGDRLRIGALVTHAQIEDSDLVRRHAPLLSEVAPHVAHRAIRNLGTFGGSIAFADPAAEWPTCLVALRGWVIVSGADGERRIQADDFFLDLYTTALQPGEVILACEVPVETAASNHQFDELVRRHGDYAIVGAAVTGSMAATGLIENPRVVFLGTGNVPERARAVETLLETTALTVDTAAEFADALDIEPAADLYHSAQTKLHLSRVVLKRLLCKFAEARIEGRHEGDKHD